MESDYTMLSWASKIWVALGFGFYDRIVLEEDKEMLSQ